ncbi:hypothetical protein BuS5_03767 [Desulfosarcina sp. BuS5]|uniref:IS1380 family transposase n=1 Tax=Desulfosarcina sp. BuS5 TaxID=933262 RepID=UPI002379CD39|nr:IS1380 family transposase [Desulfosarcina sp. BuS5]WDN89306.1 hypothetical protein BuS5_02274 [Desulfosarcina sp. BuS5]WDN90796.1 hypothetical protein BuS5_03767 [Desulfosarcina sp. BuS5]
MKKARSSQRINKIDTTTDTITGRGGLVLFSRYLEMTGILDILNTKFGFMRKSSKGLSVWILFKQIFCFFFDGTSRHLTYFDQLKNDKGYAGAIETTTSQMASSHMIKRFFQTFGWWFANHFRWVLRTMFIWRLNIIKPDEIVLYIDSMVMDNDDAKKRQGVQPTYKKKKGFHPLQIIWNGKIVDAIFRGGSKNGNFGDTVVNMIIGLVNLIRSDYSKTVTIILRCDSGFFDKKNFAAFDELNIGFIASGKMYAGVKQQASNAANSDWDSYNIKEQTWSFLEFGFRCDKWKRFYRTFYTRCLYEGKQILLDFARPDNVILTNIGINDKVLKNCTEERRQYWLIPEAIINSYHQCGADELAHRGFKDFDFEQLPFKKFGPNSAFYYCMLISFFLFETFKEDVTAEVIPIRSYATSVRRKIVDIGAKIVKKSHMITLKLSQSVMQAIKFDKLWANCQNPSPILI